MSRQPKASRKPGGQPGNQNRLVHGIYAKQLSSEDSEMLESMPVDLTEHELALARVRLKTCLDKQLNSAPEDFLTYERAIAYYLRLIATLVQRNAAIKANSPGDAFITVMEMIRQVNEEQGVK